MREVMLTYLLVAFGGALGSVGRLWFSGFIAHRFGETFPWGTVLVNISGSLVIGFFATLTGTGGRWIVGSHGREFFMYGICGGYTTFSSFSLQTLDLAQRGEWLKAGGNVVASVVLCLFAVWLGHVLAMSLNSTKGN
jgi:fluoride exporter